jgi:hypothetical protein
MPLPFIPVVTNHDQTRAEHVTTDITMPEEKIQVKIWVTILLVPSKTMLPILQKMTK